MGDKQKIVLLHGFATDSAVWEPILQEFGDEYDITAIALPGHGEGEWGDHWSLPSLDPAVDKILASGVNGSIAIGWSIGGAALMKAAADYPGIFSKLILVAPAYCFIQRDGFPWGQKETVVRRMIIDVQTTPGPTLKRFYHLNFSYQDLKKEEVKEFIVRYEPKSEEYDTDDLANTLSTLLEVDLRFDLKRISVPTLIVQGTSDEVVAPGAADYLAKNLPNAELKSFNNAGHAPFLSDPTGFAKLVKEFIA